MTTCTSPTLTASRQYVARTDRRQAAMGVFSKHRMNGRRKSVRRELDAHGNRIYVDRYDLRIVMASLVILVLCVVDAFMTLNLIEHGATEVNLVMRLAIEEGVVAFILTKYLMTAISVLFLVVHSNLRLRLVRAWQVHHLIAGFALVYVVLLIYEVAMWHSIS